MGFSKGKWLKIWKVTKREEHYTEAQASSSKKNKDGEYETDFSSYVRFVGDAHKAAKDLKDGDRIRVQACDTTNSYDKEKGKTYWNCVIFKFDNGEGGTEDDNSDQSGASEPATPADSPW